MTDGLLHCYGVAWQYYTRHHYTKQKAVITEKLSKLNIATKAERFNQRQWSRNVIIKSVNPVFFVWLGLANADHCGSIITRRLNLELVDLWDENRTQILRTIARGEAILPHERRVSIHCYIINQQGKILIQKRSFSETHFQGWWSTLGGAVTHGVSSFDTVKIEAQEELGLKFDEKQIKWVLSYKRTQDFVDVYLIKADVDLQNIIMNPDEVIDVQWATFDEIEQMIVDKTFVNQPYLSLLKSLLNDKTKPQKIGF